MFRQVVQIQIAFPLRAFPLALLLSLIHAGLVLALLVAVVAFLHALRAVRGVVSAPALPTAAFGTTLTTQCIKSISFTFVPISFSMLRCVVSPTPPAT